MFLSAPLAFSLGGEGLNTGLPWIVNLVPLPEQTNVKLQRPIRFSLRDAQTYIDPTSIRVQAGYAKVFSNATLVFDKLPSTKRVPLAAGFAGEPSIVVTGEGVQITRTSSAPQRGVYATSIDGGLGYESVMITAILRPDSLTPFDDDSNADPLRFAVFPGPILPLPFSPATIIANVTDNGTVLALEHGPRNKAVYLRFQIHTDGTRIVRLTSFAYANGNSPDLNISVVYDWSELRRYILVWNENESLFEVYGQIDNITTRLFSIAISSIPSMPAGYFALSGSLGQITALYGQLGSPGDQSTWANIAVTTDVGYPVIGNIRPGDFITTVQGAELVRTTGATDPRNTDIVTWITAPSSVAPSFDTLATSFSENGIFQMIKPTLGSTFALYLEEPALLDSNTEGFMFQAHLAATSTQLDGAASTGMGFTIFDGISVFQFQLFSNLGVNTIGLLREGGISSDITTYFLPFPAINWSSGHLFRIVVDPRRNVIRFYDGNDLSTSVLSMPFDRTKLPSADDFSWNGLTPFIIFGHTLALQSTGTFSLYDISLCHLYQAWDAEDSVLPTDATANPQFTETTSGGASVAMVSQELVITSPTNGLVKFHRTAPFGESRGAILEARLRITSWRPLTRTGTYLVLDDGIHAFALTFVENSLGRFVALSRRDGLGGFQELVGRDGLAASLSFLLDWTVEHTYRLVRKAFQGLQVFLDDEPTPRLTYAESDFALLPDPLFSGTPTLAFGQFSTEGATSNWRFVRGLFSRGYDISFIKNVPLSSLRTELTSTQAIVVAHALDDD